MRVELRLYFTLKKHAPGAESPCFMDLPEGASLAGLLELLGIEPAPALVTLVNGRPAELDAGLSAGDVVTVFPPVGGG